jgi:nucleotide-binding universal stress UspA family protein
VHRGDRVTAPARIVAATDFSPDAGYAVSRAALLASQYRASLELLHVVSRSSLDALREWVRTPADFAERMVADVRRLLQEGAADIARSTGIAATARVEIGEVTDLVLSHCDHAGLLAVGAHGLNPLRDAILGTTVERLVGRCRRPILVVRRPPAAYRNVLVPVDLLRRARLRRCGHWREAARPRRYPRKAAPPGRSAALHPASLSSRERAAIF